MGNLLRVLMRDESCCALPKHDIFVDFENAQPSEDEEPLYREAEELLVESVDILKEIEAYKGATKEIREAISTPSPETAAAAWAILLPLVHKLKTFYDFSLKLEKIVPKFLLILCANQKDSGPVAGNIFEQLDVHQALVKQFAKLIEFVLKFDELKMLNTAIQNDFSYYRRTTQRSGQTLTDPVNGNNPSNDNNGNEFEQIPVHIANSMSFFFANATPMLDLLSKTTSKFVATENLQHITPEMLSVMAKVCEKMLVVPELRARFQNENTELFILRVMVAVVILYDHVHPVGAFVKGSPIDVKGCIKVLREQEKSKSECLLNALRYTTKHVNEESTPKSIKALLFEDMN